MKIVFFESVTNRLCVAALSCITRLVRGGKRQVFPAACVIEKDVKVNIMPFRTLCSIECRGFCSKNLNLSRSVNCIFGICVQ